MTAAIETPDAGLLSRTPATPDNVLACRELVTILDHVGYGELTASMSPLQSTEPAVALGHVADELYEPLRTLAKVFLFAGHSEREPLDAVLGRELVDRLLQASILRHCPETTIATSAIVVRRVLGLWYFHEAPGPDPSIYFGDDSVALLWRQSPRRGSHTLDLCSGPGIQLLHNVRLGGTGVGVEINRFASSIARLNAAVNDLQDRVRFVVGNLYAALEPDETFDQVLANPPLLPFPSDTRYPFVGHGGDDGLAITWKILEGLPSVLRPGGFAQIIGTTLSDGVRLVCEDELQAWATRARMDVLVTITSQLPVTPGSPLFDGLVATAANCDPRDKTEIARGFADLISKQGASHVAGFFFFVTHGTGVLRIQDVGTPTPPTQFFI